MGKVNAMDYNRIIIIDNIEESTPFYKQGLEDEGYMVDIADSFGKLTTLFDENKYDLAILDINFIPLKEYYSLQNFNNDIEKVPLIINSDTSNLETRVSWLSQADACIPKQSPLPVLKESVKIVLNEFTTEFNKSNV